MRCAACSSYGYSLQHIRLQVLHGLELEYDECGAAVQLACHHVLLLGDLNFRCALPVAEALEALAQGRPEALLGADELQLAMRSGRVLHGFREAPVRFLPSFRRVAGAAGRLSEAELEADAAGELLKCGRLTMGRLRELYSVAAADGTARVPSYTDRVLMHSLTPDLQAALRVISYSSCELLSISDHRPVAAEIEISTPARETAPLDGPHRTSACEVHLCRLDLAATDAAAVATATAMELHGASTATDGTAATALFAPVCASRVASLHMLLPLPAERSDFALERLQSIFGGGGGGGGGGAGGVGGSAAGEGGAGMRAAVPWSEARRDGVRGSVQLSGTPVTHHALLRLLDEGGGILGEGVLAVCPHDPQVGVWPAAAGQSWPAIRLLAPHALAHGGH